MRGGGTTGTTVLVAMGALALMAALVVVRLGGPPSDVDSSGPLPPGVPSGAEAARVVSHVDGDTIRLVGRAGSGLLSAQGDTAVRLLEVDTPELAGSGEDAECFAEEAARALARMLPVGTPVWVQRDEQLLDRYGRTLLYLWTEDGRLVNLELVQQGYARAVLFEPNDEHIGALRRAEDQARATRRGIWGACH